MEVRAAARQAPRSVHGDTAVGTPYKADQPPFAGLFPAGDAGPYPHPSGPAVAVPLPMLGRIHSSAGSLGLMSIR